MPEALLTLLKWCLLALMYVFFFRVLQATWFSAAGRTVRKTAQSGRRVAANDAPQMALIGQALLTLEPPELAGRAYTIGNELTIGRSAGCSITLDDTYVSQIHAKIATRDTGVVLEDLGSTNGTYLNRQRVSAPVVMEIGDRVQVGSTVMELQ